MTELQDQFTTERQVEMQEIEQLKERLDDLVEEQSLSRSSCEDVVLKDDEKDEKISFNKRLAEEKQR